MKPVGRHVRSMARIPHVRNPVRRARYRAAVAAIAALAPAGVLAQTAGTGTSPPRVIGHFDDWTAAVQTASFQTLCYAFTRATASTPELPDRGPVMLWTTRGHGGGDTVRFDAGFVFAPNAAVTVHAGKATLLFATAQNRAFPGNGSDAISAFLNNGVQQVGATGPGPTGAPVTDTFSLRGFAAAQEAIRAACPGVAARAAVGIVAPPGASGTQAVRLARSGGILVAPARVNDSLTLQFAVDSGAADVSIPEDAVEALRRTGTLSDGDFTGRRTYVTADGVKSMAATFVLRALEVGGQRVENVTAHVAPARSPLLLGQSFLGRFRSWSIDNQRQVLMLELAAQ